MKRSKILAAAGVLAVCLAAVASSPALADWHGHHEHWHGHWHGDHDRRWGDGLFLGFNFGWPDYYYPPRYYYPPPVYYAPPPAAPVCRAFHGDATIDANGSPFYGTACLEGDGRWHIVQ